MERGIARCIEYITSGDGAPDLVRDQLRSLEARKRQLDAELSTTDQVVEIHPNFPALYQQKVTELQTLLEDETTRHQAMEIIRSLIDRIDVYADKKRGECKVELTGALAGILNFAQQQNTAAPSGDDGTNLVVAGACYQRYLHPDYAHL